MSQPVPSDADIARLRRMVAEPTAATYTDEAMSAYLDRYRLTDAAGIAPPRPDEDDTSLAVLNWTPTYDFHAAAAAIWEEKAAVLVDHYDFSGDGASFKRSQKHTMYLAQARYHNARRAMRAQASVPQPHLPVEYPGDDLYDSDLSN